MGKLDVVEGTLVQVRRCLGTENKVVGRGWTLLSLLTGENSLLLDGVT